MQPVEEATHPPCSIQTATPLSTVTAYHFEESIIALKVLGVIQ